MDGFEPLQQLIAVEDLPVEDKWRQVGQRYVEICEKVLVREKANGKDWISDEMIER